MADDVTLLPCPMCGGTDIRIAHLSASPDKSVWCHSCQLRTKWCYRDDAIAAWNTRVPDPRIAELEAELAKSRAWRATLADTGDELLAELRDAQRRIAELEAELDALKARRCETCLWWKATKADYGVCTREPNIPAAWHRTDFCSWYEPAAQEAADAGMV